MSRSSVVESLFEINSSIIPNKLSSLVTILSFVVSLWLSVFRNRQLSFKSWVTAAICFSWGWFLGHVRRARVPSWLQMALVAVHKQTLGCKPTQDC